MSRIQLALRVADLESSIAFYSKLFGTEPAKLRPGYANFAITQPPLKLVLIEGACCAPAVGQTLVADIQPRVSGT
jgi:catechol 2,3-dioxygenase-like lactoylglutathione lyase family enzyme